MEEAAGDRWQESTKRRNQMAPPVGADNLRCTLSLFECSTIQHNASVSRFSSTVPTAFIMSDCSSPSIPIMSFVDNRELTEIHNIGRPPEGRPAAYVSLQHPGAKAPSRVVMVTPSKLFLEWRGLELVGRTQSSISLRSSSK
ncbi:hypothetical protein HOY80DRAFT_1136770 [Tuber brumale]|nr:hypothetical protein HOY80DRAFT_1136770 [Tuber brumale]